MKKFKHLPVIAMTSILGQAPRSVNINNMFITMAKWIKSERSQLISISLRHWLS